MVKGWPQSAQTDLISLLQFCIAVPSFWCYGQHRSYSSTWNQVLSLEWANAGDNAAP
jgi:hypothetical protein